MVSDWRRPWLTEIEIFSPEGHGKQNYANNPMKSLDVALHSLEPSVKTTALSRTLVVLACERIYEVKSLHSIMLHRKANVISIC